MLKHHHTLTTALVMHSWESKVCLNPVLLNLKQIFYSTKLVNIYYLLYVTKLIFSIVVSIFFEFIVFFLYTKICICDLTSEMFPTFFSLCRNDMLRFFFFFVPYPPPPNKTNSVFPSVLFEIFPPEFHGWCGQQSRRVREITRLGLMIKRYVSERESSLHFRIFFYSISR